MEAIISKNWNLSLKALLKLSQNYTFQAADATGIQFAVRVTPDPHGNSLQRIQDELAFVKYLGDAGLKHACKPILTTNGDVLIN